MQLFQHRMRTSQHVKSVQSIMTRTNQRFFQSKSNFKKLSPQGDNITTYLRKIQIKKQNENLAKRIFLCESQHSKDRYCKEWQNVKRFLKVRSNFKKTLFTKQPKIFKFQPIQGKGKLKVEFKINNIEMPLQYWLKKNMYKLSFGMQNTQISPDKKFISLELMKSYETLFYAPSSFKRKKIPCRIIKIQELEGFQVGRFQVEFSDELKDQQTEVKNKFSKKIGKINFSINVQGTLKKHKKHSTFDKQNLPSLVDTSGQTSLNRGSFYSEIEPKV